jgi:hypothetical protein
VALHDPDYLFWLVDENILRDDPWLRLKADELARKARNIRLPRRDPQNWCVLYFCNRRGTLAGVEIIQKKDLAAYEGERYSADRIDLSFARQWKKYDKLGGRILLKAVKRLYFNDGDARLTDKACRDFFANEDNFVGKNAPEPAAETEETSRSTLEQLLSLSDQGNRSEREIADYGSTLDRFIVSEN